MTIFNTRWKSLFVPTFNLHAFLHISFALSFQTKERKKNELYSCVVWLYARLPPFPFFISHTLHVKPSFSSKGKNTRDYLFSLQRYRELFLRAWNVYSHSKCRWNQLIYIVNNWCLNSGIAENIFRLFDCGSADFIQIKLILDLPQKISLFTFQLIDLLRAVRANYSFASFAQEPFNGILM